MRGHIQRRFGLTWQPPGPWMRDYVLAVKAIWSSWQNQTDLAFSSKHYNLNLNVPLFTPAPIEHPDIPIQVAAVNPYMARVAAEVADGVRLHPVCSAEYIRQVIVPATAAAGPGFEVCLKPLIATAADEATLAERVKVARQRLAFYVSTPAYAGAFDVFGLGDLCAEMAQLSKAGQWDQMEQLVDDELLQRCVVVALYDDLAATISQRYGDLISRIEVSIPVTSAQERDQLRDIVAQLNAL